MPYKPKTPCKHPSCPKLVPHGEMYCDEHKALYPGEGKRSASARGYTRKWQRASKDFLKAHPLCVRCQAEGRYIKAEVVDHIIPHKGNKKLFWDGDNWQSLCKRHHDIKTMTEDVCYIEEYHY